MTTTVQIRVDADRVTEAARRAERAVRHFQAAAKQANWPRPPLVHDHRQLFCEPIYTDGQPYADDGDREDDEPAG